MATREVRRCRTGIFIKAILWVLFIGLLCFWCGGEESIEEPIYYLVMLWGLPLGQFPIWAVLFGKWTDGNNPIPFLREQSFWEIGYHFHILVKFCISLEILTFNGVGLLIRRYIFSDEDAAFFSAVSVFVGWFSITLSFALMFLLGALSYFLFHTFTEVVVVPDENPV